MEHEAEKPVSGDSQLQSCTLESLTTAVRYHSWLTSLVRPYLGEHPLEIGSGLGDYAQTWIDSGVPQITVSDRDPGRFALLQKRFEASDTIHVKDVDVFDPQQGDHSALVAMNVLEHIEQDVEALRSAGQLLRPGGAVVMFVPAFELAMSDFDRKVGHFRRYTVPSLRTAYQRAGLDVERIHYVNAPGLFAWFVGMRVLKMTPHDGPTVRLWDRAVVPVARAVEEKVRPPFGQSVFAVGRTRG